jgi:hypothetical protein
MNWTTENQRDLIKYLNQLDTKLNVAIHKPKEVFFEEMWSDLRKMGHLRTWDLQTLELDRMYQALQNQFLSIPGHAEYFRNQIENDRATILPKEPYLYGGTFDFNRRLVFEVLSHLPSPETIQVLGDYLDDERDAAKEAIWTSDYQLMGTGPNSHYARETFKSIGLRNTDFAEPNVGEWPSRTKYPTREEHMHVLFDYLVNQREERLKPWRAWWDEVKSGQRTFSFKGQKVEYRFKPDATWDTIPITNPPDDGPKAAKPLMKEPERPEKRSPTVAVEPETFSNRKTWLGTVFLALTTLIGLIYLRFRRTRSA